MYIIIIFILMLYFSHLHSTHRHKHTFIHKHSSERKTIFIFWCDFSSIAFEWKCLILDLMSLNKTFPHLHLAALLLRTIPKHPVWITFLLAISLKTLGICENSFIHVFMFYANRGITFIHSVKRINKFIPFVLFTVIFPFVCGKSVHFHRNGKFSFLLLADGDGNVKGFSWAVVVHSFNCITDEHMLFSSFYECCDSFTAQNSQNVKIIHINIMQKMFALMHTVN